MSKAKESHNIAQRLRHLGLTLEQIATGTDLTVHHVREIFQMLPMHRRAYKGEGHM